MSIHTYIHAHIHTDMYTYIRTYVHTYIHTYIQTDRQTDSSLFFHITAWAYLWPLPARTISCGAVTKIKPLDTVQSLHTLNLLTSTWTWNLNEQVSVFPVRFVPFAPYRKRASNHDSTDLMQEAKERFS